MARQDRHLKRALALLETCPFIDGHNDLPWVIRNDAQARGDVGAYNLARQRNDGDTDIPRLREGRVSGQVWAAYVPTEIAHPGRAVLEQIDIVLQMNAARPDVFLPVKRAADFARARKAGKIASMLAVEGGVGLEKCGIGSDFFGVATTPVGLEDVRRFPNLLAEMLRRGWSEEAVIGLAGGNFIRTFRAVEREGARLRRTEKVPYGTTQTIAS